MFEMNETTPTQLRITNYVNEFCQSEWLCRKNSSKTGNCCAAAAIGRIFFVNERQRSTGFDKRPVDFLLKIGKKAP